MKTIKQTQIKYCSSAFIFSTVTSLLFGAAGLKDICKGLLLGTFFSILNFNLIGPSLSLKNKVIHKRPYLRIFKFVDVRHAISIIPVTFALLNDQYNFWAVLTGLFLVQMILLLDHLSNYFSFTRSTRI